MNRIYLLLYLSVGLISLTESTPPPKKSVKKKLSKPIISLPIKKDTSADFEEVLKAETKAKMDKANGTIYNNTTYKYANGKPSVKVGGWKDGPGKKIRSIVFFDKKGKQTFEITDEFASHSLVTYLHFREDGSVDRAEIHENPGASRYTYLITITFTENNVPIRKYKNQHPSDYTEIGSGKTQPFDTWDIVNHSWITPEPEKIKGMHYENGMYINDGY